MKRFAAVLVVALPFLWAGMIIAISFIETPLKFTAPGITLELGLGIGQVVLKTLNRVEIGLALVAIATNMFVPLSPMRRAPLGIVIVLLALQTLWLYPILDVRTAQTLAGDPPPSSYHHIVFIIFEGVKLLMLLTAGFAAGLGLLPKETKAD